MKQVTILTVENIIWSECCYLFKYLNNFDKLLMRAE